MACDRNGPLTYVSGVFLLLGTIGICFGFGSGFWDVNLFNPNYVYSIWLSCNSTDMFDCFILDMIDPPAEWIAGMAVLCGGVLFALMAFFSCLFQCCCCQSRPAVCVVIKFVFMLISGGCAAAAAIMFAMFGILGERRWADWEAFTSSPELKYGYFVDCAGAGLMLIGAFFAILELCCCNNKEYV